MALAPDLGPLPGDTPIVLLRAPNRLDRVKFRLSVPTNGREEISDISRCPCLSHFLGRLSQVPAGGAPRKRRPSHKQRI